MKRVVLSILGGVLIPVLYTILMISINTYFERFIGEYTYLGDLTAIPIGWALMLTEHFYPASMLQPSMFFVFSIFFGSNFPIYFLLTYFVLWLISKRRFSESQLPKPPPPPNFDLH